MWLSNQTTRARRIEKSFIWVKTEDYSQRGGTSGKEPTCQCRTPERHGFNPWARKMPWRRAWQPTPISYLENPVDRAAWPAIVHRVTVKCYGSDEHARRRTVAWKNPLRYLWGNALEQTGFISCHNKEHHNRSAFLQGFKKTCTEWVSITWNRSLIVEGRSQCCLKS